MRLSASRIRSINRRLARAQGYTWTVRHANHLASSAELRHSPAIVTRPPTRKIVAVPRNTDT